MKTRHLLLLLLPLCLLMARCVSKTDPDTPETPVTPQPEPEKPSGPKSTACNLNSVYFSTAFNPSFSAMESALMGSIRGIDMALVTVPEGSDLTRLIPSFTVSDKASVYAGDKKIVSGETAVDFTREGEWKVVAEDGKHTRSYSIIVRAGDSVLDRMVYDFMIRYQIPGIGIGTTKNEKSAYCAGYGLADLDAEYPVRCTADHLFRLASVTKSQTALCILSLYEEGRLKLDDKVFAPGGILADMYPGTHASGVEAIRIQDLMSHRSGWNYSLTGGEDPIFTGDSRFAGKSLKDRVAYMVRNVAVGSSPGTVMSYYNLGFCVLGQVIEKVTGKTYEAYLREEVAKAGVKDMWVSKTSRLQKRENECVFYSQSSTNPYGNDMDVAGACGAVIASPRELMVLLCAEDYGTVVPDILSKETLDVMYTNYTSPGYAGGYGYGWRIGHNTLTNWAAFHTGNLAGTATLWVRGNKGVHGVILCNSRSYDSYFDTAMYVLLNDIMTRVRQLY